MVSSRLWTQADKRATLAVSLLSDGIILFLLGNFEKYGGTYLRFGSL